MANPSNEDWLATLSSQKAALPDDVARLKGELFAITWISRLVIGGGIAVSFILAYRLAMDSALSAGWCGVLAVLGSVLSYVVGHFGGFFAKFFCSERADRIVKERSQPLLDAVGGGDATSSMAVPSLQQLPDEQERAHAPHVVGGFVLAFVVAAGAVACDGGLCAELDALPREPRVLAIGDSILAWNNDRCHGIPERAGLVAGVHVTNRAVSGTVMHEIASQYDVARAEQSWQTVLVDGGGNDVNSFCECGACDDVLADVTERTDSLLDLMRDDGVERVILVDYFGFDDRSWYGFDRCENALGDLQAIHEDIAGERDDVTLVDLGDLVTPESHPEAYTFDHVHPSDEGSRILGELVAESL